MNLRNSAALAAAFASAGLCGANPLPWKGSLETSTRFFAGAESRAYVSFQYKTSLPNAISARVTGFSAPFKRSAAGAGAIVTGGKELEAGLEKTFCLFRPIEG